jgi:hypothetical protein
VVSITDNTQGKASCASKAVVAAQCGQVVASGNFVFVAPADPTRGWCPLPASARSATGCSSASSCSGTKAQVVVLEASGTCASKKGSKTEIW